MYNVYNIYTLTGIPDRYLKWVHRAIKSARNSRANSRASSGGARHSTTNGKDSSGNDRNNDKSNTSISLKPTFTAIKDAINKSIHSITPKQNTNATTTTTTTTTTTAIIVTPYTPSKNKGGAKVYICPEVFSTVEDDLSTTAGGSSTK